MMLQLAWYILVVNVIAIAVSVADDEFDRSTFLAIIFGSLPSVVMAYLVLKGL